MASVDSALVKFHPPKLIGDGPYEVVKAGVAGVLYKKWMGWWDAKAISVPWVEIVPMSSATEYGAILSGGISQEENSQFTDPQAAKLNASGIGHYGFIPTPVQQESLVFHFADYPFNLLAVRKALAYVIQRPKLAKLDMSGKIMQNPAATYPDGINQEEAKLYITPKQEREMNPYRYDPGIGSPMADFAATFVSTAKKETWNYPLYYNGNGSCSGCQMAIGIGPVANVPGLGRVNIGATLNEEVNTAPPSTWSKYTFDWARFINEELPILPLYNNAFHMIWSTGRYADFPSLKTHGWLWTDLNGKEQVVWMQEGFLRLKHQ